MARQTLEHGSSNTLQVLRSSLELPCGAVLKKRIAKSAMSDSLGNGEGDPKFPVFDAPLRGGVTAWYSMRLTALGGVTRTCSRWIRALLCAFMKNAMHDAALNGERNFWPRRTSIPNCEPASLGWRAGLLP